MADLSADVLGVWLGSVKVGTLSRRANDQNIFLFDPAYRSNAGRPLLSLSYLNAEGELRAEPDIAQMKVPPFFANLLPEGPLRRYLARGVNASPSRDFPLLEALGEDLPGAMIVRREGLPTEAMDITDDDTPKPSHGEALRFSLAGVQMKFSASGTPQKGLTIPVRGRGGHWILKLPSAQYALLPENEHLMMRLAGRVGIQVAETGLVPVGEIEGLPEEFLRVKGNALWVARFDRTREGRVHMEDFNQIYRQFPEEKYDNWSYTTMARDLNVVAGLDHVRELVRRIVFSAGTGNADMHLKNWSLLYIDGRTPSLSPSYDFVSTIAYLPDDKMALSIANEKRVSRIDSDRIRRFAARALLPERLILETALEAAERLVHEWSTLTSEVEMQPELRLAISERLKEFPLTAQFLV